MLTIPRFEEETKKLRIIAYDILKFSTIINAVSLFPIFDTRCMKADIAIVDNFAKSSAYVA